MPSDAPPPRLVLQLERESLSLWVRLRDGSQRSQSRRVADEATLSATLQALLQPALAELLAGRATKPVELVLVNQRPLSRLLRGELPPVTLLATAGVHEALHAALAADPDASAPGGIGRSPSDPCFALVGDASELWPEREDLSALCPASHLLPVDERLSADGTVLQALTAATVSTLVSRAQALAAPAAVVLLHSLRHPAHEEQLTAALRTGGVQAVASSVQLAAHRGGLDERLRVRAAVLSAALSPGCAADLAAVRAGVAAAMPTSQAWRILLPRGDGACAPVEHVPPWQLLLAPIAMALRGSAPASSAPDADHDARFFFLAAAAELPAVAAICQPSTAIWKPGSSAVCLGIPCELPALCVAVASREATAQTHTQRLAAAYGFSLATSDALAASSPADSSAAVALPLRERDQRDAIAEGALLAPLRYEVSQLLCAEASGAQESGLLATTLRRLSSPPSAASAARADQVSEGHEVEPTSPGDWTADLRYQGQAGLLSLRGVGTGGPAAGPTMDLVVRFVAEHERVYGFSLPQCPVELLQVRLTARR